MCNVHSKKSNMNEERTTSKWTRSMHHAIWNCMLLSKQTERNRTKRERAKMRWKISDKRTNEWDTRDKAIREPRKAHILCLIDCVFGVYVIHFVRSFVGWFVSFRSYRNNAKRYSGKTHKVQRTFKANVIIKRMLCVDSGGGKRITRYIRPYKPNTEINQPAGS